MIAPVPVSVEIEDAALTLPLALVALLTAFALDEGLLLPEWITVSIALERT